MGYASEVGGFVDSTTPEFNLRRNISAIDVAKEATYSHAPPSAYLDPSNLQAPPCEPGFVPFNTAADFSDPLTGFLRQSSAGVKQTEAERIGADRFGAAWPMIRAQRLHSGDEGPLSAAFRRAYAHSRIGTIFTPLEVPQNPRWAHYPRDSYSDDGRGRD